jgi:ABC-type Mn2+/Zn2+ transport system ATPase subunit
MQGIRLTAELLSDAGKLKQECTIVVVSHDLHELSEQVRTLILLHGLLPLCAVHGFCVNWCAQPRIAYHCTGRHRVGDAAGWQVAAQTKLARRIVRP